MLDPIKFDVEPDQARYSRSRIMDESEAIRQQIQEALFDMLCQRRSLGLSSGRSKWENEYLSPA